MGHYDSCYEADEKKIRQHKKEVYAKAKADAKKAFNVLDEVTYSLNAWEGDKDLILAETLKLKALYEYILKKHD